MSKGTPVSHDAREFGVHVRSGGWRLGLLVARSVEKKDSAHRPVSTGTGTKVSARQFAEEAGTSPARVLRYLEAWDRAAAAGQVPPAHDLNPGVEIDLPDGDETAWSDFYDAGKGSTDDSVRRSIKAVERNIDNDPEFAARVAAKLAESQPATLAKQASNPDVARAIARNDDSREAVEEQAIQHRARHRRTDLPDPKEAGRRAGAGMARRLGFDVATEELRSAAGRLAEAIVAKEEYGITDEVAEAEALQKVERYLTAYRGDGNLTDADQEFLASLGIRS